MQRSTLVLPSMALDRFGLSIPRFRYVRRLVVEGFAGLKSHFLMFGSALTDYIVPAVVPCNSRLAVDHGQSPPRGANRLLGRPIVIQRDEERVPVTLTHLPFADEVRAPGHTRTRA